MSTVRWLVAAGLAAGVGVATAQAPGSPDAARRRTAELERQVRAAGEDTRQLESRLAALREELERLREQVAKLPSGQPDGKKTAKAAVPVELRTQPAPAPDKAGAKEVDFRLARGRVSSRESNVGFVCKEKKVYVFDIRATTRAREQAMQQNSPVVKDGGTLKVPSGDFDIKVEVARRSVGDGRVEVRFKQELTLRPGRAGETLEQARAAGSEYRKRLDALTPGENVLQFSVYSDSFDLFRELRQLAWSKEFDDIAWEPYSPVQTIGFGFGQIIAQ